jgi:hypothetical protein
MSALPPYDPTCSNRNPNENTAASSATVGSTSTTTARSTAVAGQTIPSIPLPRGGGNDYDTFNRLNPSMSLQSPMRLEKPVTIHSGSLPGVSPKKNALLQPPSPSHEPDVKGGDTQDKPTEIARKRLNKTFTFDPKLTSK